MEKIIFHCSASLLHYSAYKKETDSERALVKRTLQEKAPPPPTTGKIVQPIPTKILCSYKSNPPYEADTKNSNDCMYAMQHDKKTFFFLKQLRNLTIF